ncbi:FAD-dependent oxidoreductase [bacterium]|nr:FAD-dependent oxidoreductase [bacterium]
MAIVTEAMRRGSAARRCDVAVVGAGLPGLISASILARGGARVVLLDVARRPGGRLQTLAHQGFAIDVSPPLWESDGLVEALAAAGVAAPPLAPVVARRDVFAAVLEGGAVQGGVHPLPAPGTVPSPAVLEAVASLVGVKPRAWARIGEAAGELLAIDDRAEQEAAAGVASPRGTLGEWAASLSLEPAIASGLLRSAEVLGAWDGSRADARRVAHGLRRLAAGDATHVVPAENAVAGARGLIDALVDAAVEAGVEMRLGTRVLALEVDGGRLRGLVVQREELPFLATLEADRVVLAVPPRAARRILPALAPAPREAPPASGSMFGVAFGLGRAPWPQDAPPPPAVRLLGPPGARGKTAAPGTPSAPILLSAPQAHAPATAPPGKALLLAHVPLPGDGLDRGETKRVELLVRSAVLDLHPGVEIEWERSWLRAGEACDPFVLPASPEPLTAPAGVHVAGWGVRLARCVTSGPAAAAASAVAVAQAIASERDEGAERDASLGTPRRSG